MEKLIRITTVPQSLHKLLEGQLRFMNSKFEVIGISSPGERLEMVEKEEGVRVTPVLMTRNISPLKDLMALWKLYRILKKEKPTIVHTHTPKAGTIGMWAAKLAGVKHRLHTVAGLPLLEAKGKKRKLLDVVEMLTYKAATQVYSNSFGLKDIIIDLGYTSEEKISVIGNGSSNGIDIEFFNPKKFSMNDSETLLKSLNIPLNHKVFLFIGRMVSDKGVNELVEAFEQYNKENPNSTLLLVGDYEKELDPLKPLTYEKIQTNSHIVPTGYQKDVRPFLAASHVFVFPSYREGLPNVVLQAGAMGLPVIASDINGNNEIITDGLNGRIIPVKSSNAILNAMTELEDEELVASLKSNARKEIVRKYDRKVVQEAILQEYERILTKDLA